MEKISDWAADSVNEEELSLQVQKLTQSKDQRKVPLQIIRGSENLTSPEGSRFKGACWARIRSSSTLGLACLNKEKLIGPQG